MSSYIRHFNFKCLITLTAIEVAQIVRETFSKATITNRRVKLEFKPQYAYIEELVKYNLTDKFEIGNVGIILLLFEF